METNVTQEGVYTISVGEKTGRDNLGHTISVSETTLSPEFLADGVVSKKLDSNEMTISIKMGKRVAIGVDSIIVLFVGLILLVIELGIFPHTKRGFFCDDSSIAFKFQGDTISTALIVSSVFVPFFFIWIGESIFYQSSCLKTSRVKGSCFRALRWFREYIIGIVIHLLIMDVLKVFFGEHRPHFFDTCKPDTLVNCTTGTYITEFKCTNQVDSQWSINDSSKSFPSGHSSVSFFEAIFMIWYLQYRIPNIRSRFLIPFLQCLCLLWACITGLSRIVDHRHHWWDVLFGAILGIFFAYLTCTILCNNFKRRNSANNVINQNGTADRHQSVRRLLSDVSCKDELRLNHVSEP